MGTSAKTISFFVILSLIWSVAAIPQILNDDLLNGSVWDIQIVDSDGDVGGYCSIDVDSNDIPHISYSDRTNFGLKYAKWNGTGWSRITVKDSGGSHTSLVLDSNDRPHISHRVGFNLEYVWWDGIQWKNETVDAHSPVMSLSLALDSNDYPHIGYMNHTDKSVRYAKWNGNEWIFEIVQWWEKVGLDLSLALDSHDNPHLSYLDFGKSILTYANITGGEWVNETLDPYYKTGYGTSIAVNSTDRPYISYASRGSRDDLRLARLKDSGWQVKTVDYESHVGTITSLAIGSDDNAHIAYTDNPVWYSHVKYAEVIGLTQHIETVDTDFVGGPAIALDSGGIPHICYYDFVKGDLKYATKVEIGPAPEPVLSFSPSSLDFGTLPEGSIDSLTFEIWNSGDKILYYSFSPEEPWVTNVIPSGGSSAGEYDSIEVTIDTTAMASGAHITNVSISSNGGNGSIEIRVNVVIHLPSVSLNTEPNTLNLKSNGRWITAYLTIENGLADDIDASSLMLNDLISPDRCVILNNTTLVLKFNRFDVQSMLSVSDSIGVKISGIWKDGTSFEALDFIRVIDPGH